MNKVKLKKQMKVVLTWVMVRFPSLFAGVTFLINLKQHIQNPKNSRFPSLITDFKPANSQNHEYQDRNFNWFCYLGLDSGNFARPVIMAIPD